MDRRLLRNHEYKVLRALDDYACHLSEDVMRDLKGISLNTGIVLKDCNGGFQNGLDDTQKSFSCALIRVHFFARVGREIITGNFEDDFAFVAIELNRPLVSPLLLGLVEIELAAQVKRVIGGQLENI